MVMARATAALDTRQSIRARLRLCVVYGHDRCVLDRPAVKLGRASSGGARRGDDDERRWGLIGD